jgi:murein L,D-transpeptidase YcbB/YkuD
MFKKWYIRWRNKKSAKKLGWKPEWFGATKFDDHLTKRIEDFQKKHNLKRDGMCDVVTYKILVLKRHRFIKKIKAKKTNYNNG